jgi:hypothetical protein
VRSFERDGAQKSVCSQGPQNDPKPLKLQQDPIFTPTCRETQEAVYKRSTVFLQLVVVPAHEPRNHPNLTTKVSAKGHAALAGFRFIEHADGKP